MNNAAKAIHKNFFGFHPVNVRLPPREGPDEDRDAPDQVPVRTVSFLHVLLQPLLQFHLIRVIYLGGYFL